MVVIAVLFFLIMLLLEKILHCYYAFISARISVEAIGKIKNVVLFVDILIALLIITLGIALNKEPQALWENFFCFITVYFMLHAVMHFVKLLLFTFLVFCPCKASPNKSKNQTRRLYFREYHILYYYQWLDWIYVTILAAITLLSLYLIIWQSPLWLILIIFSFKLKSVSVMVEIFASLITHYLITFFWLFHKLTNKIQPYDAAHIQQLELIKSVNKQETMPEPSELFTLHITLETTRPLSEN